MRIIEWAILFLIITLPLYWVNHLHAKDLSEVNRLQLQYTSILRTAAQDGASALNINEQPRYESGYGSMKYMRGDVEEALGAIKDSLFLNFGIQDDVIAGQNLMLYIPAIAVIQHDGYSIYGLHDRDGSDGEILSERHFQPKKPYVYSDALGNSIAFTLDSYVIAYDTQQDQWYRGLQEELSSETSIPLLQNKEVFDQVRRTTIVQSIEEDLTVYIAKHNQYARQLGLNYTFTLPVISQEEWNNTLDDVGVLLFLQGIPVGDRYYNNYALGGGRVVKKQPIYGGKDEVTGLKYYFHPSSKVQYVPEEVFTSERDAASNGYFRESYEYYIK